MSLNILGGTYKGFTLQVPPGDFIRPTSVMLRRKIFDARQNLTNFHFVDLCAGSGAVGIEALSRGAESLVLVEKNFKVYKFLKENAGRVQDRYSVMIQSLNKSALDWINSFRMLYQSFDEMKQMRTILFLDPPYEDHSVYHELLGALENESWYFGELWLESDEQKGISQKKLNLERGRLVKTYVQGTNYVAIINYRNIIGEVDEE